MDHAVRTITRPLRCILFDFDFTLVDSSRGAHECTAFALRALGLGPVAADRVRATIGMSLDHAFRSLTGIESPAMAGEFCRIFIKRAEEVMAELTHVYAAARPAVFELKRRGLLLGIVSNKYRCGIAEFLGLNALDRTFDIIVGGEDVVEPKPSPLGLRNAAARLGVVPGEVLYVGDGVIDAETARRASMSFVAVLTGTTSREAFVPFFPVAVVRDLEELIARLDELAYAAV
jgi:phosphoglycolate phosphatase